jgi:RNA polymerase sigma-70 factor, ECF subfamily
MVAPAVSTTSLLELRAPADARPAEPDAKAIQANAELDLVRRAQTSDNDALSTLCTTYYPRVFNYCLSNLRDVPSAEDLASDVMLKMVESIDRYKPSGAPFSAWVFRIARNRMIDQHRHGKRRRRVPLTEHLITTKAGPDQLVEQAHEHRAMYDALEQLRPSERDVIILRFIGGLDTRTVSALLGRTESAVKSLQHRGLKTLRRKLAPRLSA